MAWRLAWIGPAPPNAISAKSRGSCPRAIDTSRMPLAIALLTTVATPAAASTVLTPSGLPTCSSIARSAAAVSSFIVPPRNASASSRPRQRLASVTVGSSPPRPKQAGPGTAPALSGPTRRPPAASARAMLPPPAPIVFMSSVGTAMRYRFIQESLLTTGLPSSIRQMS